MYLYWIYAAKILRTYVRRIYTLLQGQTVRGPTVHFFQGGQLGPGQLGPGAQLSGAQLSRGPTVRGPTVRPQNVDSWAPGPNYPGPNCPGPNSPRTFGDIFLWWYPDFVIFWFWLGYSKMAIFTSFVALSLLFMGRSGLEVEKWWKTDTESNCQPLAYHTHLSLKVLLFSAGWVLLQISLKGLIAQEKSNRFKQNLRTPYSKSNYKLCF